MASPFSSTSPSSPSSSSNVGEETLPLSPNLSSDEKAARALEALMWPHNLDSTVSESLLSNLRECYSISEDYVLLTPRPGQRAYDPIPKARSGFRVSGAPSSNKGWKGRFFYNCCARGWSFKLRWSARMIDNTAPVLNDDEHKDLWRLKEILPVSRAI
ncbi:hypothetical protein C4D60_Mb10t18960 [Musa balbisiana]|uniref:Uncharacterized protein n=1 Tax=Musa balbisiana TaxID=52838 RepID=A0A4S8IY78_MUSBA|nr:hypothetical protein C4D60_Mb10t18960 [Musa balbisiana]